MMESCTQDGGNNHIHHKDQKHAIREILSREDDFLKNLPKQPKKEIGDYVESQGILVPKRFKNLETALMFIEQGGKVIIRSEHPDEYKGIAGLLESYSIDKGFLEESKKYVKEHPEIDWENIRYYDLNTKKQIFGNIQNQEELEKTLKKLIEKRSKYYCKLLHKDFEDFNKEISYSYREKSHEEIDLLY